MGGETGCADTCKGLAAVVSALTTSLPGESGAGGTAEQARTEEGEETSGAVEQDCEGAQAATVKDWHAAVLEAALQKLWQSERRDPEVEGWRK